jgi:hypothetical protein
MFHFTIRDVEAIALSGTADELRGLRCPQCGLGLSISYIAGKRPTVAIRCVSQECMTAVLAMESRQFAVGC